MHPKISWLLASCFLLWSHFSFSQTKRIVGQVFVFNSKMENGKIASVENVKIFSPQAKPTYSDEAGRFKLKLNNVVPGMPVFFQIEKDDYEVVDHNNLQYHLIDEKTRLRIFLAKKGYLKKVRFSLMESATKSINAEKERLLDLLAFGGAASSTAFKIIEKRTGMKFNNAYEAEKFVKACSSDIEERLRLCAYELAIVNPDFASETFMSALGHYQRSNLEAAIATLQSEDLEEAIEKMEASVKRVKSHPSKVNQIINRKGRRFDQIKDCYLLQIIALQQSFRLKEAHVVLKKLAKANAIAPTHKHTELIEKLDFFKFLEMTSMEEELALGTTEHPTSSAKQVFEEEESLEISENEFEQSQHSVTRKSKLIQRPKTEAFQDVSQKTIPQNSIVNHPTDILRKPNEVIEYSNVSSSTPNQPIVVHQSNGQNETIITIKISTSNGSVEQSSEYSETTPVIVKVENTAPPKSYDLAAKGFPTKTVKEAEANDFETILFPVRNSAGHFKIFVEKEIIQETTKKIHPHTKR